MWCARMVKARERERWREKKRARIFVHYTKVKWCNLVGIVYTRWVRKASRSICDLTIAILVLLLLPVSRSRLILPAIGEQWTKMFVQCESNQHTKTKWTTNDRPTTDHHPRYDTGAAADAFLFALFISKEITTDSNTLYYMILLKCWPLMMFSLFSLHIFFLLLCSPLFTATCLISFHFIWAFCCIYFKRYRNYIDHNDSSAPSILVLLFYRYGWFP